MNKGTIITFAVVIAIFFLAGLYTYSIQHTARVAEKDSEASRTLTVSEEAPYTDLEGNPFSFDDYRGQVRVVNAWASWCPFCTNELADFEQLAQEFSEQNVAVIAINRKEPRERAKHFLSSLGEFTYIDFAIDLSDAYYTSIGGFSMPETVFYDREGNIVIHKRGFMDIEEMRTLTNQAITALDK
ncbi:MAG: thiol-disulfide isomerase/thioredoxin [Acidimicrobiales bacterium]|jgi:thiol-disulfide isomerase/thioredoxin